MKGLIPMPNIYLQIGGVEATAPNWTSQVTIIQEELQNDAHRGRRGGGPESGGGIASTFDDGDRRPTNDATLLHPFHLIRCRANISPKPSMTPLMNGSSRLIVREETNARTRARRERDESNIEIVTEGG